MISGGVWEFYSETLSDITSISFAVYAEYEGGYGIQQLPNIYTVAQAKAGTIDLGNVSITSSP
jgi:hypothetical protein